MQMIVSCDICSVQLTVIDKECITQEDIDLYTQMCQCSEHPLEVVDVSVPD